MQSPFPVLSSIFKTILEFLAPITPYLSVPSELHAFLVILVCLLCQILSFHQTSGSWSFSVPRTIFSSFLMSSSKMTTSTHIFLIDINICSPVVCPKYILKEVSVFHTSCYLLSSGSRIFHLDYCSSLPTGFLTYSSLIHSPHNSKSNVFKL